MAKKNLEKLVFFPTEDGWQTAKGVKLDEFVRSDALRDLLHTDYNVFFRISDSSMTYEIRKSVYNIRIYIERYV